MCDTIVKDKDTMINEIVWNASIIMERKIDYLKCVADQFESKGDLENAKIWRSDIPAIKSAIEVMRKTAGCWA